MGVSDLRVAVIGGGIGGLSLGLALRERPTGCCPTTGRARTRRSRTRFDDLGIDSLPMVDVVVAVEDRFGLVIPDDEWAHFETVGDVSAHVQRAARLPR